jgi:putative heme-binding domain-containing protein
MAKLGGGRMPHIGSTHVDAEGVALLQSWIEQLPVDAAGKDPSHLAASHSSAIAGRRQFIARLKTTPAANVAAQAELVDGLLTTTSGALQLLRAMDTEQLPEAAAALAVQRGARHELGTVRDLFERFLPPDQRVQRLGTAVQPQTILALKGEIEDGRKLFFETAGVSCRNCHRIQEIGKQVGPDLTSIGKSRTREQLLESLLEPSKRMEPKYVTHLVETSDGRLFAGLLIEKTDQQITLLDAKGEQVRIPQADVEQLVSQRQSLMPDLLFRDMTAQQVADLVAYLASLK